ncbi:uncharacterized protein C9orf85 homolog [Rana temporaria]|uniref:uncharacterized protein C9orf85 homolog n=1 Tax=Rana temporaria TaxID=8407 RepID=UPI001AACCD4C|nr:uncharacterized protein C9orf85 homolog [Rana temporaria]
MSSQRGNVQRSRPQKHKNATVYKNDKYETSSWTKAINSKLHDGVCQRCKDVLEWKVKFSKYKSLSQPKKCVKCLQKTVKDAYHIICKPCATRLDLCAKCGKNEDIVVPIVGASTAGEKAERDSNTDSDLDLNIDLEVSDDELPEGGDKDKRESVCRNTTDVKS